MKRRLIVIISIIIFAVTATLLILYRPMRESMATEPAVSFQIHKRDDAEKSGGLRSRIVAFSFSQKARTSGRSPDELVVSFDAPVEVSGVLVSVDLPHRSQLFELAGTINSAHGYETNLPQLGQIATNDALVHVSWNQHANGQLDEQVLFNAGEGFVVNPDDKITFGSWMSNSTPFRTTVWPELIIYYRWL